MHLYLTSDKVGSPTGGGSVTAHELRALLTLGDCAILSRDNLISAGEEPWGHDNYAAGSQLVRTTTGLCHVYSGTFSKTISKLKSQGVRTTYTVCCHDKDESKREHEAMGLTYGLPHLTDPALWDRYVEGMRRADVVVCPSYYSAELARKYGLNDKITVIPHGVEIPKAPLAPLPRRFTVGYLGQYGSDKGVRYLLEAWKRLDYPDATLRLAGAQSTHPWVRSLVSRYGGGNVELCGWVDSADDFYDSLSLYVQPSTSEAFGLEILEALARGRPVISSTGAGGHEALVGLADAAVFAPRDVELLAGLIDHARTQSPDQQALFERAKLYDWELIRQRYADLWKGLLS